MLVSRDIKLLQRPRQVSLVVQQTTLLSRQVPGSSVVLLAGGSQGYPSRTQITHQACEEGWSFIAEWTGVPLSYMLDLVGADPRARYVVFCPFAEFWESIDMADALLPQTYLAYGMNGQDIPTPHGVPVRLRVARQLGYKSVKYLSRVTVTDTVKHIGKGLGGVNPEYSYSWWAGI